MGESNFEFQYVCYPRKNGINDICIVLCKYRMEQLAFLTLLIAAGCIESNSKGFRFTKTPCCKCVGHVGVDELRVGGKY